MSEADLNEVTWKEILSFKQTDMLKHAWGYHSKKPGFRTHRCDHVDDKNTIHLVSEGYLDGPHEVGSVGAGCGMYYLTEKAIKELVYWKHIEKETKRDRKKL